jgi:hypothetical protein
MSPYRYFGAIVLIVAPAIAAAQEQTAVPQFNTIRTPASPAFVLLGVEPTSVARPTTPADFAASLINASENFPTIPRDFALEVSPYWLATHARQNWKHDTTRSLTESLQRTFTVAAGTAQIGTEDQPVTGVALSGRAALLSGHLSRETVARLTEIDRLLPMEREEFLKQHIEGFTAANTLLVSALANPDNAGATADNTTITAGLTAAKDEGAESAAGSPIALALEAVDRQLNRATAQGSEEDRKAAGQAAAVLTRLLQEPEIAARPVADTLAEELNDFASTREGVFLELAAGASWNAPSSIIDSADLGRWGAWLTLSYELPQLRRRRALPGYRRRRCRRYLRFRRPGGLHQGLIRHFAGVRRSASDRCRPGGISALALRRCDRLPGQPDSVADWKLRARLREREPGEPARDAGRVAPAQ